MNSKNIFLSKTFWFNVFGFALSVSGVLPPKYGAPAMAVANVGLRLITNQPVNVFGNDSSK